MFHVCTLAVFRIDEVEAQSSAGNRYICLTKGYLVCYSIFQARGVHFRSKGNRWPILLQSQAHRCLRSHHRIQSYLCLQAFPVRSLGLSCAHLLHQILPDVGYMPFLGLRSHLFHGLWQHVYHCVICVIRTIRVRQVLRYAMTGIYSV